MYQDLSKHHDWPVKKAMVHLPISLKGNSERISGNSLSPFGRGGGGGGVEQGSRLCFPANPGRYQPGSHDLCDQANNSEGRNKSSRIRIGRNQGDSEFGRLTL